MWREGRGGRGAWEIYCARRRRQEVGIIFIIIYCAGSWEEGMLYLQRESWGAGFGDGCVLVMRSDVCELVGRMVGIGQEWNGVEGVLTIKSPHHLLKTISERESQESFDLKFVERGRHETWLFCVHLAGLPTHNTDDKTRQENVPCTPYVIHLALAVWLDRQSTRRHRGRFQARQEAGHTRCCQGRGQGRPLCSTKTHAISALNEHAHC